ncbi:helix-turn-helix transcriptional regulator [Burkholderia pseudomallei]|uniref:helix-turn-helix transcriptional regulator n=1 Tax=Burkholderia pseudomallei TaxID=28450 RepID=UPI000572986A|nr:AlpA family phage regulatory protein [Burkholderia pseudomallei]
MSQSSSRALRPAAAAQKLGIGLSTLYAKVKNDATFPRPIKIGPRTTVFTESSLDNWMATRVQSTKD